MTQAQTLSELHKAIASQYDLIAELEATVEAVKAGKQKEESAPKQRKAPVAPADPPKRRGRTPGSKNKPKTPPPEDPGIDPADQAKIDALNRDLDKK